MRLFAALCRRKMPHGHIHRGKQRLYEPVTLDDANKLRNHYVIEEQNMFYLRHAYLTPEQSHGHAVAMGRTKDGFMKKLMTSPKEFKENVTIESRLAHLRHTEGWD